MVIVNIGGEGEVVGAINVNNFILLRRPLVEIAARGPVIGGDFTRMPIANDCIDLIVGNMLPFFLDAANRAIREAYRVLRPGGDVRCSASTGGGAILLEPMQQAGFIDVGLLGNHATGRKP